MIDAKMFMEFFEKECDIKFIDTGTGKPALDVLNEFRTCKNCKYGSYGDGINGFVEDLVCVNAESEYTCEFMSDNDTCEFWETAATEGDKNDIS